MLLGDCRDNDAVVVQKVAWGYSKVAAMLQRGSGEIARRL